MAELACDSRMPRYIRGCGMVQEGQKYEMQFRMPRGSQDSANKKRMRARYLTISYSFPQTVPPPAGLAELRLRFSHMM